jgi:hypothetical protein
MAVRFTCTINTSASDGEHRRAETQQIAYLLEQMAQQVNSGAAASNANLRDRNGSIVGSWTYSPTSAA